MQRWLGAATGGLVAGLAALAVGLAPAAAASGGQVLFRLHDPRLDELSGLAAGVVSPGVVYAQNDSGDSARFFALNARSGDVVAVVHVPGAANVDWEDLAVAPDAAGTSSVWLADTGDNDRARKDVQLYRVPEPRLSAAAHGLQVHSSAAQVWRLRYPDGPHDTESLAVGPDGAAYLVTKSQSGTSEVFAVPRRSPARVATLRRVGTIRFPISGTPGPFGVPGELAATGATMSRDGRWFVVRTYTDAYAWRVRGDDVAAALRAAPTHVALPRQPQGEGICIDGTRLLLDSEGTGTPVLAVRASFLRHVTADAVAPSSSSGVAPSSSGVRPRPSPSTPPDSTSKGPGFVFLAVVVIAFALGGTVLSRRRGSRPGGGPGLGRRPRRRDQWPYTPYDPDDRGDGPDDDGNR